MLAFFNNPVQLVLVMVVVLVLFGPQKLPEIGMQLGRALRELRRATQDFQNAIHSEDRYEPPYEPPRYDSYNGYNSGNDSYTSNSSSDNGWQTSYPAETQPALPAAPSQAHGDFAAPALADTAPDVTLSAPEGAVPRSRS